MKTTIDIAKLSPAAREFFKDYFLRYPAKGNDPEMNKLRGAFAALENPRRKP